MTRKASRPPIQYPDLAAYLRETGDSQANVARCVGVNQAYISRVANGHMVPRPFTAARIAMYARIPLDSFMRVYLAKQMERVA